MVSLYYVIQEMHSFSMRPAKYFYDKPLPKYLDPKTVLIYRPHPVYANSTTQRCPNKIIKIFLLQGFFPFVTGVVDTGGKP